MSPSERDWREHLADVLGRMEYKDRAVIINLLDELDGARSSAAHDPTFHMLYFEPFKKLANDLSDMLHGGSLNDFYWGDK